LRNFSLLFASQQKIRAGRMHPASLWLRFPLIFCSENHPRAPGRKFGDNRPTRSRVMSGQTERHTNCLTYRLYICLCVFSDNYMMMVMTMKSYPSVPNLRNSSNPRYQRPIISSLLIGFVMFACCSTRVVRKYYVVFSR